MRVDPAPPPLRGEGQGARVDPPPPPPTGGRGRVQGVTNWTFVLLQYPLGLPFSDKNTGRLLFLSLSLSPDPCTGIRFYSFFFYCPFCPPYSPYCSPYSSSRVVAPLYAPLYLPLNSLSFGPLSDPIKPLKNPFGFLFLFLFALKVTRLELIRFRNCS